MKCTEETSRRTGHCAKLLRISDCSQVGAKVGGKDNSPVQFLHLHSFCVTNKWFISQLSIYFLTLADSYCSVTFKFHISLLPQTLGGEHHPVTLVLFS